MRDYSFGNFISALRMRRGLSQYQLGALVGVSDKAVSKWENGVSKPRMNTIVKLAEVLDVGTDELLACKYVAFNHRRKDLFAMDNEIIKRAEQKMKMLYGECPPIRISNRFKTEELMLHGQMMLRWMGFMGRLHDELYEKDGFFLVRGAQMGASFIAWLLDATNVNPLPAHYYCPKCKKIEFIPNEKCGLDAPDKICLCGTELEKDGFGIDAVHMYPLGGGSEIYISSNATEIVRRCFEEYFEEYSAIREIRIEEEGKDPLYHIARYVLLPNDIAEQYSKDAITVTSEEYYVRFARFDKLSIVENTEEHISFKAMDSIKLSNNEISDYARYASKKGMFKDYFGEEDLNGVVAELSNPKFSNLITVSGLLHGTGAWTDNGEYLYAEGIPLEKLISNREDLYAYLYSKLNGTCCDNPSGQVYEIMENVRKGKYRRNGMPAEIEQLLLRNGVPEWYVESMKKMGYLFPKAHVVTHLKRDLCNYIARGYMSR